ncbi:pyridoxamine 5'-phosphate oxidase family protein [Halobacterium sp. R2-5]|uniref:pyridoxamine 5'-phosphate oxidase family protein n=1 Tax=Halobacterium sp. R2-5 TaxID=2715751 RepID=UPI0014233A96|nr:pyridoxamine 5'-phosphate oxidase family protein [Halobacterium sp. R2-5]NIB99637.1 pyridoxamine 5'-phosphate oxidase family protein [Halobacterium sp. R2-5]
MEEPDTGDRPLRGVAMDEAERDEFLRERGIGVLSLASEDVAYGFPISFGWDGDALYFVLLRFGEDSEKLDYAATTETATFSTYNFDDEHHWRSVVARGPIEEVSAEETDDATDTMFDNAQFASLFPHGEPITDQPRYRLDPEEITGQKGQGYDD